MALKFANMEQPGFKNKIENVAIVGAGGHMGRYIVTALLSEGKHNVTAITRADSTNNIPSGVQVKQVDYEAGLDTLVEALRGHDVLIITLSMRAAPGTHAKLVDAAKLAGIEWIIPNEYGNDTNDDDVAKDLSQVYEPKRNDRAYIEAVGLNWVGFCTGFWYEWSLGFGIPFYGIDIAQRTVRFMDDGTVKLNTSTWKHAGLVIAKLLALPLYPQDEDDKSTAISNWRNKIVHTSSFAVSQRDMLESLYRVTSTTEKDWTFLPPQPAEEKFAEGKADMAKGDMLGFAAMLYSRFFFPRDRKGFYEESLGLDDNKLGINDHEDLDEATARAVKLVEDGFFKNLLK